MDVQTKTTSLSTPDSKFGCMLYSPNMSSGCVSLLFLLALKFQLVHCEPGTDLATAYNQTCPTWTYPENGNCECGYYGHDIVMCNNATKQVRIQKCYCMTMSVVDNRTQQLLGNCMFNCGLNSSIRSFYSISRNTSTLNNRSCGQYNRDGQMCSKCAEGYAVPAYTHSNNCTKCEDYSYNWIKYTLVAFLPLTLFYIILVVVRLDTTRSVLSSYILVSQIITAPIVATLCEFDRSQNPLAVNIVITVHEIWNLNFGRSAYEPFCLHPDLTMHQVIALDYLIAVYPLLLILLTYLLVKLHDSYRLAVLLWKPFHWCIRRIQKEWNVKASLIDVFATFLLLSNVKLLNVSFDLISVPVTLWKVTGHSLPQKYTYLNGSLEYLGKEHLPYFVLGVTIILVFNVLPILLLCLYPFRWFQRCLNHCSLSSASLHIFMDAFQGCYKTSPRDYRRLSAIAFIFRLVNFLLFYLTINPNYFTLLGIACVGLSFFIMLVQPYKSNLQTNSEGLLLLDLGVLAFLMNSSKQLVHNDPSYRGMYFSMKGIMAIVPNIVLIVWISHYLIVKSDVNKKLVKPLQKRISRLWRRASGKEATPLLTTELHNY